MSVASFVADKFSPTSATTVRGLRLFVFAIFVAEA